jgi:hypothetical protein
MFQIPSQPHIRLSNYVADEPFLSKRWIRSTTPSFILDAGILLPMDSSAFSKEIDPNWRKNWKQVLLVKPGANEPFRPIVMVGGKVWTTIFPVQSRLFSMRVGSDSVKILLTSRSNRMLEAPDFYSPDDTDQPLVLKQDRMATFVTSTGLQVVDI